VAEAQTLAQPEEFDYLALLDERYSTVRSSRRYAPSLLETFEFRAAPAAAALLEVIEILRTMNRDKSRSIPQKAPLEWIPQRWQPYVVTDEGIDRAFTNYVP